MRLINAELLLDNLSGRLESIKDYDTIKEVVNNMPTAYDVDKVVEQLEKEAYTTTDTVFGGIFKAIRLSSAIEIVKGSGKEC